MKADLKEDLKKKKPLLGLNVALKKLRSNKLSRVYVSSNSHAKDKLVRLANTMNVDVVLLSETSKDLGVLCKKPFSVSIISFE